MSSEEKKLKEKYPAKFPAVLVAAKDAYVMTDAMFPDMRNHNDCGDAFRHAYWNASMTNRIGSYYAELFATAHESDVSLSRIKEKEMDLYINAIGRNIGKDSPNAWYNGLATIIITEYLEMGKLKMFECPTCGDSFNLINTTGC